MAETRLEASQRTGVDHVVNAGETLLQGVIRAAVALNVVIPFGTWLHSIVSGDNVLQAFEAERSIMTWYSSLQMLLIGAVAYATCQGTIVLGHIEGRSTPRAWVWFLFAGGFVFLSLDERFMFHEFIRSEWLRPSGVTEDSAWIRPGDVMLYVYLGVGIALAGFLVSDLGRSGRALNWFLAAVGLAGATVVIDALPLSVTRSLPLGAFWDSAFEEVPEIWAQCLFLVSFSIVLRDRFARIRAAGSPGVVDALSGSLRWQATLFRWLAVLIAVGFPIGYAVFALATETAFWRLFASQYNASEWLSSMICIVLGLLAVSITLTRVHAQAARVEQRLWIVTAAGLFWFALDERFDLHEWLRDTLVRPAGVFDEIPYLVAGDIVLYVYLAVGLGICWSLRHEFIRTGARCVLLVAALLTALSAIVIDSLDGAALRALPNWRMWDYAYEEVAEIWAELLFLTLLISVLEHRVNEQLGTVALKVDAD